MRQPGPDRAQEIVAETFLVAWQRLAYVPGHGLPWLLVVARNTIRHSDRSRYRDRLLTAELGRLIELTDERANAGAVVAERDLLLREFGALPRQQREALLLVSWDGLSVTDAARSLDARPAPSRSGCKERGGACSGLEVSVPSAAVFLPVP
ncbi:RNA polymerase sigma factor [Occultella gossypii]|uniref:RNA polymerase sigma factor n=1 Tax=Occultella gossypii TaxID=2800820 RepID=UPI003558FF6C